MKAVIVRIGTIEDNQPVNFIFDCLGTVSPFDMRDGEMLWGGYSIDELKAIILDNEDAWHGKSKETIQSRPADGDV